MCDLSCDQFKPMPDDETTVPEWVAAFDAMVALGRKYGFEAMEDVHNSASEAVGGLGPLDQGPGAPNPEIPL